MIPLRDTVPASRTAVLTYLLLIANVFVFGWELTLPEAVLHDLIYDYGIVPARYFDEPWGGFPGALVPLFTTQFLHGSWFHLLSNMWSLWLFGDNVEDRMGPLRFLLFYLICGLLAGWVHMITHPESALPAVGASGAIAGVMGAYLVLFPRSRLVMFTVILFYPVLFQMPAVFFLIFWFVAQLISGAMVLGAPDGEVGVAFWAHIGGFLAGLILHRLFLRPERTVRWV